MKTAKSISEIRQAVRQKFAWPGGYPLFLVMSDGESLCVECGRKNWKLISHSTRTESRDGWKAEGAEINWESVEMFCAHCGKEIESAYGERGNE